MRLPTNNDFNGELANCVLAYIEETDLSANERAYARIKDWTTNDELWIRRMRTDTYKQRNTLHFIQTANHLQNVYVEPGDTRIVVMLVLDFEPGEEIPKNELKAKLQEEAPHFMRTIMDLSLPSPFSRLGLPPLRTRNKDRAEEINSNDLEVLHQRAMLSSHWRNGGILRPSTSGSSNGCPWRSGTAGRRASSWMKSSSNFLVGAYTNNKRMIGNLSLEAKDSRPQGGALDFSKQLDGQRRLLQQGIWRNA